MFALIEWEPGCKPSLPQLLIEISMFPWKDLNFILSIAPEKSQFHNFCGSHTVDQGNHHFIPHTNALHKRHNCTTLDRRTAAYFAEFVGAPFLQLPAWIRHYHCLYTSSGITQTAASSYQHSKKEGATLLPAAPGLELATCRCALAALSVVVLLECVGDRGPCLLRGECLPWSERVRLQERLRGPAP
jgi:hypothetical protein